MSSEADEQTPLLRGGEEDDVSVQVKSGTEDSTDEKAPPAKVATLGELFSFSTCLDTFLISMGSLAAMGVGAGLPLLAVVLGSMTDDFINGPNGTHFNFSNGSLPNMSNFDFEGSMNENSIKLSYIGAGVFVCSFLQICGWMTASERQIFKMRKAFFKAILRQNMEWFDTNPSAELTTRLTDDLERMREGMGDKFAMMISSLSQFLSGLITGFVMGWELALVMLSVAPLLAISFGVMIKFATSLTQKEQAAYAKAGSIAEEVFSCIRTVISFCGWRKEKERYSEALEESQRLGVRKSLVQGLGVGVTMLCMFGSYGLAFWYGSTKVYDYLNSHGKDGLSPGDVFTDGVLAHWQSIRATPRHRALYRRVIFDRCLKAHVFICVLVASMSLGQAAPNAGSIAAARGAGGKVFEIMQRKPPIDSSSADGDRPRSVEGKLEFKNVSFSYPTRENVQVLKGFDLSIEPGQTVALVGGSGCGKSTIIKMIQRFYDPGSGNVELDGRDLTSLNLHWLRRNIGIVSQEPVLFSCSIQDNIRLGCPDATDEEIIQAAKDANAHDFICGLPKGYDTLVGERGAQLSGGQKQRVAIARALVRNPKILLLDEATSALDSESEQIVQSALDKAREGRTTVVVAHRLSTIQNADVIYVLHEGELAESGSHSELIEKGGLYHQLVTLQQIAQNDDGEADSSATAILDQIIQSESENEAGKMATDITPSVLRQRSLKRQVSKPQERRLSQTKMSTASGKDDKEETEMVSQRIGKSFMLHHINQALHKRVIPDRCLKAYAQSLYASEVLKCMREAPTEQPGFCEIMSYNAKEWPFIVLGCFAAILNGGVMPVFAVLFSKIIGVFSETGDKLLDDGIFWALMFVALGGLTFCTNIIQNFCFGQSGERLTKRLRLMTFQNLLRQDVAYFDDPHHATGALTARLATDASVVRTATGIRLALGIQALTGMVAGVVIAFVYGWKLALVVMGTLPFMIIATGVQMKILTGNQKADIKQLEVAGKTSSETIDNIATVQSLTREPHFYDKYCSQLLMPYKKNLCNAQVYAVAYAFATSIIFFIYAGCFRFGAYLVGQGEMTAEEVYRVFMAMTLAGQTVGQTSSLLPDYTKGKLAAAYIFRMMRVEPTIDNSSKAGLHKDAKGQIELNKVEFHYPMRPEIKVLKGISLQVEAGQTAALVGISGCGKSTIISLLQRYYDPTQGSLMIDGTDIREYNISVLRSMLSVVSQEPVLFDCSIRENIVYGLQENVPMADIIEACKTSNIHEFIAGLPEGYDTQVGGKGTQLSGGQKQRVAIARALIRNPRILLLDEATSALDTESEKLVQQALDNAREGRTCVVIAHRLSTIQNADIIFVMENGQVLEKGTHQELLALQGAYAGFVSNQKIN